MKRVARKSYPRLAAIAGLGTAGLFVPTAAFAAVIASSSPIVVPISGVATPYTNAAVNEYSTAGDPLGTGVGVTSYATGTTLGTYTLKAPTAAAYDSSGNLYVTDNVNDAVYEIPTTGPVTKFISTTGTPGALAIYGGNFYVVRNGGTEGIYEYNSSGAAVGSEMTIPGNTNYADIIFDSAGNMYVSNGNVTGIVYEIPAGGGTPTQFITGLNTPQGMAIDKNGNFYVVSHFEVYEFPSTGGAVATNAIASITVNAAVGLGFDANGTLFTTDTPYPPGNGDPDNYYHAVQEITGLTGLNTGTLTTFITYSPEDSTDGDQVGGYFAFAPTPEPATLGLLGMGAMGLLMRRRRKLPNL